MKTIECKSWAEFRKALKKLKGKLYVPFCYFHYDNVVRHRIIRSKQGIEIICGVLENDTEYTTYLDYCLKNERNNGKNK